MNNITCTIPNKRIEQLADKLKETTAVTNNMVSLWQTQNNTPTEYPTVAQLWELKKANNAIYKEAR